MTKHKHTVAGKTYTIAISTVPGFCCWATVKLGRARIGETQNIPYGMRGVAYERAVEIAERHASAA
jgi:hypothetical protein